MLPLLLILFIITLFDSHGHPFFVQERYGYKHKIFKIYKFRSLREEKSSSWGRFMRYTSIDELPQLFNILKGDMVFIGPRPLSIKENDIDIARSSEEHSPYDVYPGLTGYAQIRFKYNDPISVKAKNDSYYVEHFSLFLDIKILILTIVKFIPIRIHKK